MLTLRDRLLAGYNYLDGVLAIFVLDDQAFHDRRSIKVREYSSKMRVCAATADREVGNCLFEHIRHEYCGVNDGRCGIRVGRVIQVERIASGGGAQGEDGHDVFGHNSHDEGRQNGLDVFALVGWGRQGREGTGFYGWLDLAEDVLNDHVGVEHDFLDGLGPIDHNSRDGSWVVDTWLLALVLAGHGGAAAVGA